ncbi:hypothetical protein [Methanolobus sp. ZRKC5]|uniref:hypothetical protein n=1 Tax=unclassified Methanolobus TaxID=2629569 RepID=UPI00313E3D98
MDDEIYASEVCNSESPIYGEEESMETDDCAVALPEDIPDTDMDQLIVDTEDKKGDLDNACNPDNESELKSDNSNSLIVITENSDNSVSAEDFSLESSSESNPETSFQEIDKATLSRLKEAEMHNVEMESRLLAFEDRFTELQTRMDESLNSNGNLLSSIEDDLQTRANEADLKRLQNDFNQFSKRLKRVVQAEDSVNAESLDATKVPPDVLEITYAKTLNDVYAAMLGIYGDSEAAEMVEDARDSVRQFSAGIDFFRFEDDSFVIRGLSEAISSKIVSVKQIHGTYIELFKILFQYVPNYNSQDFRSFVETGSREYTIKKVVFHEGRIDKIISEIDTFRDEISNITENVSFIAELQNNQLEETASNSQELGEIREQMKSVAKAVNLHTKAIKKLSKTLAEFQDFPTAENRVLEVTDLPDLSRIEEMLVTKAGRDEILTISGEMESFKANVENMFSTIQQQLQESMVTSQRLSGIEVDLSEVQEGLHTLNVLQESKSTNVVEELKSINFIDEPKPISVAEEPKPVKLSEIPIEDAITGQLSILGSATLKQLEKQIQENGFSIDFEKLSLVIAYLEQEQLVSSTKKGRYTFYSVTEIMNV